MKQIGQKIVNIINSGGVGILPTDTLYGLVGSALNRKAVERINKVKRRGPKKPFIILISGIKDLELFGVEADIKTKNILSRFWPGSVSIVLKCPKLEKEMSYLQPLNKTLAFRCPEERWLNVLLEKTGPLVAPSANPEGLSVAETIKQAKKYFGGRIDFYVEGGILKGAPSTLISLESGNVEILRKGNVKISNNRVM